MERLTRGLIRKALVSLGGCFIQKELTDFKWEYMVLFEFEKAARVENGFGRGEGRKVEKNRS